MKILAIVSGGLDSTVLAYHLAEANQLGAIFSVNYGQRHAKELVRANKTATRLDVPHIVANLQTLHTILKGSALTDADAIVPEGHYTEENMAQTVVPNRNMILMSLAVGAAIAHKLQGIAYGAHSGDHAIYADCRPEFAAAMSKAVGLCDFSVPLVLRPFIDITKADIVALGLKLKVPFEGTWTCYNGDHISCGRCGTCVERLEAFAIAGAEDPLEYVDRTYWRDVTKIPQLMSAHNPGSLSFNA